MKRAVKWGVVALVVLTATSGVTQADQIFNFTITGGAGSSPSSLAGTTVTGTIDLPFSGDGTGAASHIDINSYPSGLGNIGTPPLDATTWSTPLTNTFTVTSGAITAVTFEALNGPSPDAAVLLLEIQTGELEDSTQGRFVLGSPSAGGSVVYSAQTATPEPASLTLLCSAFCAVGGFHAFRRRRHAALELCEQPQA
jgi:hypothetical protein